MALTGLPESVAGTSQKRCKPPERGLESTSPFQVFVQSPTRTNSFTSSPRRVCIKSYGVPVLLETVNAVDRTGNASKLTAQVILSWFREGVARIDNKVDSRVACSSESPSFPFDVPEVAIRRNWQSQDAGFICLCLKEPSACITHFREVSKDQY